MPVRLRPRRGRLYRAGVAASVGVMLTVAGICFTILEPVIPTGSATCPALAVSAATDVTVLSTSCGQFQTDISPGAFILGNFYELHFAGIWSRTVTAVVDVSVRDGLRYA